MRGFKSIVLAAALLVPAVLLPKAGAQVSITFGAPPPCPYGYYGYAPYSCAPPGYYGPGYFYNGVFLGVGPWAYWGYNHGWGSYRFRGPGGGHYYPHSGYYPGHPPRGDTRRITGHRSPTNLHITEDTRRITAENRRTTVANRPTMEDTRRIMVAVNRRTMVAGRQVVGGGGGKPPGGGGGGGGKPPSGGGGGGGRPPGGRS